MNRLGMRILRKCVALVALLAFAVPLIAQDRPVVLIHGFNSSGAAWGDTVSRLRTDLSVDPYIPNIAWGQPYFHQAVGLNDQPGYGSLPANTIALGHSNGGIVAREWSTIRPLAGVVTIGTPHGGVPLIPQFYNWRTYQASARDFINNVGFAFGGISDWSWVFAYVHGALSWMGDYSIWSVIYLGASLGMDQALPITADTRPGSEALNALNSPANLSREQAALAARVGIVSMAHNFYWAGPARAIIPDQADAVAAALYSSAAGLAGWATYLFLSADPLDLDAVHKASSLYALSGFMLSIDPVYCSLVSSVRGNECVPSDGVVPYTSQTYPGAHNVYIGFENNDGPAHTQEMRQSDVLADVLVRFLQVPRRGSVPVPPVPGPGPGDPNDPGNPGSGSAELLSPNQALDAGQSLRSTDGRYELVYQGDGNLVLYDATSTALWASNTGGISPGFVVMQGDGNFVIYDDLGAPAWSSGSAGHPGAWLVVQNDGNVVIYDADGTPLWATDTGR